LRRHAVNARFVSATEKIYDQQIRAKDNRANEHRDVKLEAITDHATQQCRIRAPARLHELLPRNNQQSGNHDCHENVRRRVQFHQRVQTQAKDDKDQQRIH
jgi:hypothetical protein